MVGAQRADKTRLASARGWAADAENRFFADVAPDPEGGRVRLGSYLQLLAAPLRAYTLAALLYLLLFFWFTGPNGRRGGELIGWPWTGFDPGQQWTMGMLTAAAGTVLAVAVRNLQMRSVAGRPRLSWWRPGDWYRLAPLAWLAGAALVAGIGAQARLVNDAGEAFLPAAFVLAAFLLLGPAAAWLLDQVAGNPRWAVRIGLAAGVVFVLLRLLPWMLSGDAAQGVILGFHIGEVARVGMTIATALALAGAGQSVERWVTAPAADRRWLSRLFPLVVRVGPALLLMGVMALLGDLGPAVILALTVAALVLFTYPRKFVREAVGLVVVLAVFFIVTALMLQPDSVASQVEKVGDRFEVCQGDLTQACKSLRVLHVSGLMPDVDPAGSQLIRHLEAADSDYAITAVGSQTGLLLVLLLVIAVAAIGLLVVDAAVSLIGTSARAERAEFRGRLGVAAGVSILVPAAWMALAVLLPGFVVIEAKVPLTGIDIPFVAANGSSTLAYASLLALGMIAVLVGSGDSRHAARTHIPKNRRVLVKSARLVAVVSIGLSALGSLWILNGGGDGWWAGGARLVSESLLRDTGGRVVTLDGEVFSRPVDPGTDLSASSPLGLGNRVYPNPSWAVDLGFFLPGRSLNSAVGLELLAAPLLTCGDHRTGLTAGFSSTCAPADVIATVDGRLQNLAAKEAAKTAAELSIYGTDPRVDVVLIDRATGSIRAMASSDAADAEMQAIIGLAYSESGWEPAGLTEPDVYGDPPDWPSWSDSQKADRVARYALDHMRPNFARCVNSVKETQLDGGRILLETGNPSNATFQQCERDKQSLRLLGPIVRTEAPGSTFKIATALAGQEERVPEPRGQLGPEITAVGDKTLARPVKNWFADSCNLAGEYSESTEFMLAKSCNTTAVWLGLSAGADGLLSAAGQLGFAPSEPDLEASQGSQIWGAADPSAPEDGTTTISYPTAETGLAPNSGEASGSLCAWDDNDCVARTSIGQQGVRAGLLDIAAMAWKAADPDRPGLRLVEGACLRTGAFEELPLGVPERGAVLDEDLDVVRAGMAAAVDHPSGTAHELAPYGVVMAKTGTAELNPPDGPVARWVTGLTDDYVFAARVTPVGASGPDANPTFPLIIDLLKAAEAITLQDPVDPGAVCRSIQD